MYCEQLYFFRDAVVILSLSVFDLGPLVSLQISDMCKKTQRLSFLFRLVYLSCYEFRCILRRLFEHNCLNIIRHADDIGTLLC